MTNEGEKYPAFLQDISRAARSTDVSESALNELLADLCRDWQLRGLRLIKVASKIKNNKGMVAEGRAMINCASQLKDLL